MVIGLIGILEKTKDTERGGREPQKNQKFVSFPFLKKIIPRILVFGHRAKSKTHAGGWFKIEK